MTLKPIPIHWARPKGETFEEMRANIWKTPLPQKGDTILVWVNEGDFLHAQLICGAVNYSPTEPPIFQSPQAPVELREPITDDALFNIATEAWSTRSDKSWSSDGLEAAILAVREALSDPQSERGEVEDRGSHDYL